MGFVSGTFWPRSYRFLRRERVGNRCVGVGADVGAWRGMAWQRSGCVVQMVHERKHLSHFLVVMTG